MKKMFWISALLLFGIVSGQAQDKYGHLNFGNLIAQMPQTKAADETLKVYGDSLVTAGEQKAADFGKRAQAFVEKVQKGELPPVEQQKQQQALEQEQAALQQLDMIIQQQVAAKREELLKPIVDIVESAINEYAKENGYTMIFDTSVFNSILYAQDSDDLMDTIKAKLGI